MMSGNVLDPDPATNEVMTKSSNDKIKVSKAAEMIPGQSNGTVIFQNAVISSAPSVIAASSSVSSIPASRDKTTTTTKEIENATCAMTIVPSPNGTRKNTNKMSSEIPVTISGVTMGT